MSRTRRSSHPGRAARPPSAARIRSPSARIAAASVGTSSSPSPRPAYGGRRAPGPPARASGSRRGSIRFVGAYWSERLWRPRHPPPRFRPRAAAPVAPRPPMEEPVQQRLACPSCGAERSATAAFCPACGTAVGRRCERCGTSASPAAQFCGGCGADLAPARAGVQAPTHPVAPVTTALRADPSRRQARQPRPLRSGCHRRGRAARRRSGRRHRPPGAPCRSGPERGVVAEAPGRRTPGRRASPWRHRRSSTAPAT